MDIKDLSLRKADIVEGEVATAPSSENNTRKIQRTDKDILLIIDDGGELWSRSGNSPIDLVLMGYRLDLFNLPNFSRPMLTFVKLSS